MLALAVLSGCDDSRTVAKVGRTGLTVEDVTQLRAAQSPSVRAAPEQTLEVLVDRALLAEEARRQKLHEQPTVKAQLAAAERELLAHAVLERAVAPSVTDEALRARYEAARSRLERREVHVAQIFARMPEGSDEKTRRQAQVRINQAYARLAGGEPFETVARELSEDLVSAPQGGELGVVREGGVDPAFFAQAVALAAGAWSKPFITPFGWHVVKALEASKTVVPSFDEARGVLESEARQEAQAKLMERLRQEISVRRYPERLKLAEEKSKPQGEGEAR
ncbi:peptidylprolyl isomerase [Hyalangium minutum]|uniref:Survival protein SurA (Peptidyl-prolyl cis-trans isomerase SurA) n=1 Tax=Hyalangium minutum TaxID=394096 RepID=A0A085WQT6_9BACT|nr:peptidylprolyl isomerase [Hyalangium minutum]KFE70049.1 Survival protein SurA precursor (Peptidyl-prolyl cis-trans isomerase SurA) [Hyalangium minutum]